MAEKKEFKRLSRAVRPTHYDIKLQPDLEKFTFTGCETIDVEVKKSTSKFSINSLDIRVHSAIFIGKDETFESSSVSYDKDAEKVTFKFPLSLPVGKAQLKIEFDGELNDKMKGFYRSKYSSPDGDERHCAVTQFEPTDARRAFPCWDEPAIKATFDITLVVPKDRVALSNMNVVHECDHDQIDSLRVVKFATTPIMSTYLVAFIVGEFDYVEDTSSDGVLVRVYTPLGKKEQGQFGLQVAVKTLPFYKEYFGIAYPLNKMDLIAIPDFAAGAMENWGLVTYRETALLVDPEQSSAAAKQWVALVVGHEIAHQWFGNLVTMEWWTHLWLNEGFATWIEYLCVDHCFPEYDIWTQFTTTDYSRALELDALDNSHPIEVPVGHPSEIDEIFDAISYCKGASVIRMLHEYIGDADFRKGLNCYLEGFKFSNGKTEDLWSALEHASRKPVGRIMTTWTKQMGFPVISVDSEQNGNTRILRIKQSKFSSCGGDSEENSDYQWMVPITLTTSQCPEETCMKTLLGDKEMILYMDDLPADAWVKFNTGQVCYYRVKYSSEMLESLVPAIKSQVLPPVDRLGIESDMFAMAQAGLADTVDYFKVLEGFPDEVNYTVWNDIASNVAQLAVILQATDYYSEFTNYCLKLFSKIGEKIKWECDEDEGHLDSLLRSLVLGRLGKYGHQATVEESKRRFTDHCSGSCQVPADLRGCVYGTVIAHGDCDTLDAMIRLYKECDHMEEKSRLLRCMGSCNNAEIIKRVLEFSISDDVRSQDTVFAIGGCTSSALGRQMAWDFLKEHWTELNSRYGGGFLLSRLVKSTTENFCSMEHYNDVKAFFESNPTASAERAIQQSLESIKLNASWLERDGRSIKEYLASCCTKGQCEENCC